jgi:hypothetical protein
MAEIYGSTLDQGCLSNRTYRLPLSEEYDNQHNDN